MKNKFDTEDFMLEVKQVVDLLKCLNDFFDESVVPEAATQQEREISAVCFVNRLPSHRALLNVSIKNLEQALQQFNP